MKRSGFMSRYARRGHRCQVGGSRPDPRSDSLDVHAWTGCREPVLVASTDGVGTKLKVAIAAGRRDSCGADLVNHCFNDILVQGAAPRFFLDYIATGKLEARVLTAVIEGIARGCRENGAVLLGGETAAFVVSIRIRLCAVFGHSTEQIR